MSADAEEEEHGFVGLDDAYLREIKGKIDSLWKIQRQMERCAILRAKITVDPESYYSSVRELFSDCPINVKEGVLKREAEYNVIMPKYRFRECCGRPMIGTPENPLIDEETGDVVNPIFEGEESKIDYEKWHDIIKEELDKANLRWEYRKAIKEEGLVPKPLSEKIINEIKSEVEKLIFEHRKKGYMYTWFEFLDTLRKMKPQLPTPPPEQIVIEDSENV